MTIGGPVWFDGAINSLLSKGTLAVRWFNGVSNVIHEQVDNKITPSTIGVGVELGTCSVRQAQRVSTAELPIGVSLTSFQSRQVQRTLLPGDNIGYALDEGAIRQGVGLILPHILTGVDMASPTIGQTIVDNSIVLPSLIEGVYYSTVIARQKQRVGTQEALIGIAIGEMLLQNGAQILPRHVTISGGCVTNVVVPSW